ncbi:MAG: glycosyltransferase family 39 protein [Paracoccaceae bacterium]
MERAMGPVQRLVSQGRGLWLALLVMVVLALPGFFTLPPVDRDEVLFSQASSQMLDSGIFVDIRFADGPRYKKPVGIYWLQAAAAAITGQADQIWSYRLVSLLGALLAVGFTHATARLFLKPEAAFLAAVALAASVMLGAEARLAKTDAMLLATVVVAQYVLACAMVEGRLRLPLAMGFWAALAASVLIKGPIGPMVVAFTLVGQCIVRRDLSLWRALRPMPGIALLLALAAPWFIAISYVSHGAFWSASLGRDMFEKLASGKESHGFPPGSYLAMMWLTFWPAAMPLAAAIPAIWRGRRVPLVGFALCWLIPTWLVFEVTATKLVHYTLPTWPAMALLLAYGWETKSARVWWPVILPGLLPLLLLGALDLQAGQLGVSLPVSFWVSGVAVVAATALIVMAARGTSAVTLAAALATGGLALNFAIYPTLAGIAPLWPARPLAAFAASHPTCDFAVAGYAEPSVVFLTGNHVQFVDAAALPAALAAPGCHVIALPAATPEPGLQPLGEVRGLDLGTGHKVDLGVWLKP